MKILKQVFLAFAAWFFLNSAVSAQLVSVPAIAGYLNDSAGLINGPDRQTLTHLIQALDQKTTAQVAVLTVKTTRPEEIAQFSIRVFDSWKIGQKGKDNGVLIVVAVDDRKAWITTGYGLEGALPDVTCSEIVRQYMVPYFKNKDYSQGIRQGTIAVIGKIAKEYGVEISNLPVLNLNQPSKDVGGIAYIIFFIFLVYIYMLLKNRGAPQRNYSGWYDTYRGSSTDSFGGGSSGSFGGGFGGFGGGSSGGGGGGGSW